MSKSMRAMLFYVKNVGDVYLLCANVTDEWTVKETRNNMIGLVHM